MIPGLPRMSFEEYMMLKGRSFESWDLVTTLNTTQYWRIITPPNRSIYLGSRSVSADAGPIFYSIYPDAVVNTIGASANISNRRQGGYVSAVQMNRCTLTGSPGFEDIKLIARGQTGSPVQRQSGNSGSSSLSIIKQNTTLVIGVRSTAEVTNVMLRFEWMEGEPLGEIYD